MWLLALLSCVGLMICGTPAQGDPPNGDELQLTTQPVVTAAEEPASTVSATTASSSLNTKNGGAVSETNPYQITSAGDMVFLSTTTNYSTYWGTSSAPVYYELTEDITIVTDTWTPIGDYSNNFYGNFNGNGHTISIRAASASSITMAYDEYNSFYALGLFGYIYGMNSDYYYVENLMVEYLDNVVYSVNNPYTRPAYYYYGGVVGHGVVKNVGCKGNLFFTCYTEKVPQECYIGGVAGYAYVSGYGVVGAYFIGELNVGSTYDWGTELYVGGIIGYSGHVSNCAFIGSINAQNCKKVGGIVGRSRRGRYGIVSNCFAVISNSNFSGGYAGGIGGDVNTYSSNGGVSDCYVEFGDNVSITATGTDGGASYICPYSSTTITNCYYKCKSGTTPITNPIASGTEKADLNLKSAATFEGWDTSVWYIEDGVYPKLVAFIASAVSFTVIFNNDTPKGGLFLYVLQLNNSGGYSEIRQYYFEGIKETETITYQLIQGANYKVLISKPYVWEFDIVASGFTLGADNTFTVPDSSAGGTIAITASGGTPPNNFAVV